jgi:predicted enzyme related to lactoylglutathione lyase
MANPFVHVELHTKDLPKARKFCAELFGWNLQDILDVGDYGTMSVIRDPPGAVLALWQSKRAG